MSYMPSTRVEQVYASPVTSTHVLPFSCVLLLWIIPSLADSNIS